MQSSYPACKCLSEELKADPLRNVYSAMFVVIFILDTHEGKTAKMSTNRQISKEKVADYYLIIEKKRKFYYNKTGQALKTSC